MRAWLTQEGQDGKHVAVVHCKAGKGRSGTVACSYLISQEGWRMEDALQRFTERRMRPGFGPGVSIPSQRRWVGYVNRWTNAMGRNYVDRAVEILEIQIWGLRDGVKVAVEGYGDQGKMIRCFHLFRRSERIVMEDGSNNKNNNSSSDSFSHQPQEIKATAPAIETVTSPTSSATVSETRQQKRTKKFSAVLLRPTQPIILPSSDVNIGFERRTKATYTGWAMVTSVAHVWFNAYFEGGHQHDSGVFECEWENLDGIKGTMQRGTKALDRVKVVWRYAAPTPQAEKEKKGEVTPQSEPGEEVPEARPADWRSDNVTRVDGGIEYHESATTTAAVVGTRRETGEHDDTDKRKESVSFGITRDEPLVLQDVLLVRPGKLLAEGPSIIRKLGPRKQTEESMDISLASSVENLSEKKEGQKDPKQDEEEGTDGDLASVQPFFNGERRPEKMEQK